MNTRGPSQEYTTTNSGLPTPSYRPSPSHRNSRPSDEPTVSTTFHPNAVFPPPTDYPWDAIIFSLPDSVYFHVHRAVLETSKNYFASFLNQGPDTIISLPETSTVLNCMLHILYNISSQQYCPSIDVFQDTFSTLVKYGFPLSDFVNPHSEAFEDLLIQADSRPLHIYALAASFSLEFLAVSASSKALACDISDISQSLATQMGAIYLLRLLNLQANRRDQLKKLLLVPPETHDGQKDVRGCRAENRASVMRAYSLAVAYLAWEAKPSTNEESITASLYPLLSHDICPKCERNLRARIQTVLDGWKSVPSTI